ncbi:ParA family protein [Streptomyces longispororuber]|uniref:ParA family protein n=1 Tax=Streptomyces longispororuber TaxID=68230 RepID=UPI00210B4014|nr:AAA family ATPase [Streptomyces longispororuber]MCQ4213828.1 AAA family ATPase [Streptomyces longispororuber]
MASPFEAPDAYAQQPGIPWEALSHIFMFGNGKGGVGKSSVSANAAGKAARSGLRTLIIDCNAQGNIARELGYKRAEWNDGGAGLLEALRTGAPLTPRRNVRENLDVVMGGPALGDEFGIFFHTLLAKEGPHAYLRLLMCLLPIAHEYQIIILDTPPENPSLQRLALSASRWLVIPVKSDGGAEDGLAQIGMEFSYVKFVSQINPHIALLGVLLFDTGRTYTGIHADVRRQVRKVLGEEAHMFKHLIGHTESVARLVRKRGLLVQELVERRANGDRSIPETAEGLAADYEGFTEEMFARALELRKEATA